MNVPSLIKMKKYEKEYFEHRKLMKLRSKIKPSVGITMYKIHDIAFKNVSPDPS